MQEFSSGLFPEGKIRRGKENAERRPTKHKQLHAKIENRNSALFLFFAEFTAMKRLVPNNIIKATEEILIKIWVIIICIDGQKCCDHHSYCFYCLSSRLRGDENQWRAPPVAWQPSAAH